MATEYKPDVQNRGNGDEFQRDWGGMGRRVKRPQVPEEFITPGKDYPGQLAKSRLDDLNQLKAISLYHMQLKMFGMDDEIADLRYFLAGTGAIMALNSKYMLQAFVGVYFDADLSKEDKKLVAEMNKQSRREAAERREGEAELP